MTFRINTVAFHIPYCLSRLPLNAIAKIIAYSLAAYSVRTGLNSVLNANRDAGLFLILDLATPEVHIFDRMRNMSASHRLSN